VGFAVMMILCLPGTLVFLYLVSISLAKAHYLQSISYSYGVLIFICPILAYCEHQQKQKQSDQKKQKRRQHLQAVAEQVSDFIILQNTPAEIRRFLSQQFLTRLEKIVVLYLAWSQAVEHLTKAKQPVYVSKPSRVKLNNREQDFEAVLASYGEEFKQLEQGTERFKAHW
jgi:hypothetical protein